ncbi:hypothetical protein QBC39DRAFT_378225 [Podospora conica]|nr:hypothetical protein QBC39DRAFT_378225 [Schizothecium conicum]
MATTAPEQQTPLSPPSPKKILVLGGTGPAGILLIRELLHRNHPTLILARTPSKIPASLLSNPLLTTIAAPLTDLAALSTAVSQSHAVLSLLGPSVQSPPADPTVFADFYRHLLAAMRAHGVRRILAMGTVSISDPMDSWSVLRAGMVGAVRMVAGGAYRSILGIGGVFSGEEAVAEGVDWTVFRIGGIFGEEGEEAWRADREDGETYAGPVGGEGWTWWQKRAALGRWLVDQIEGGGEEWVGKMPAVSRLKGSARREG